MATRMLLGFNSETDAEDVALHPDSIGFVTYYAARGINYRVPTLPQFETPRRAPTWAPSCWSWQDFRCRTRTRSASA
jgi:hypothetical protein